MQSEDAARLLIGRVLTEVDFVHDYVHLVYGDVGLTVNAPMVLATPQGNVRTGAPQFEDLLRRRTGHTVTDAKTTTDYLRLEFDDGGKVDVSLVPDDQVSPEAAVLEGKTLDRVYVW